MSTPSSTSNLQASPAASPGTSLRTSRAPRLRTLSALGLLALLSGLALATQAQPANPKPAMEDCPLHDPAMHAAAMQEAAMPSSAPAAHGGTEQAALPTETGQAAFAALAEMVRRLDADPDTDWSRVSIRALRDHLVDMSLVTLQSEVDERPLDGGFIAHVTGEGRTREAIRRMVPAHAQMLSKMGYRVAVETTDEGVDLTVRAPGATPDPEQVARLRGLGFFGVMALGDHHRLHHLAMATGGHPHGVASHSGGTSDPGGGAPPR